MSHPTARALAEIIPGRWIRGYQEWECLGERWSWTLRWSKHIHRWFAEVVGPPGESFSNHLRCYRREWRDALRAVKRAAEAIGE